MKYQALVCACGARAQGCARKEVPARAVAIDEVNDLEFLHKIFWNRAALVKTGLCKFKSFEEFGPTEIYTRRILAVLLVEVFNGIDVCIANIRNFIHGCV
mgnify:CR=1 FL=1